MMKPEPAPATCSRLLPKRRRNSRPSGVSRSSGGNSLSMSPPETVSVTAMFTTAGSTFFTSGARLSGAARALADCGEHAVTSSATPRNRFRENRCQDVAFGRRDDGAAGMVRTGLRMAAHCSTWHVAGL